VTTPQAPDPSLIDHALRTAAQSPCRSKRGAVIYDPLTGVVRGDGYNGPPCHSPVLVVQCALALAVSAPCTPRGGRCGLRGSIVAAVLRLGRTTSCTWSFPWMVV
jgi:hypothetical protein